MIPARFRRILVFIVLVCAFVAATPLQASAAEMAATPRSTNQELASFSTFDTWTLGKLFKGKERLSPEQLAHVQFWVSLVKEPLEALIGFIPRLFVAVVFMAVFWALHRALRRLLIGGMGRAGVDQSIRDMLSHVIKWGVMGFGLVIAFNQIGIQITALLTGVSIIGLALGLAAQDTLANFIAAIVIIWDEPFRVGHGVSIDGVTGTVMRVTFRSTRILTADGDVIAFPNSFMLAHRVSNQSVHSARRVTVPIEIGIHESIDAARAAMLALLKGDPRVSAAAAPGVIPTECANGAVKLVLQFWVADEATRFAAQTEYLEKAKEALDQAGVELSSPQMRLSVERRSAA